MAEGRCPIDTEVKDQELVEHLLLTDVNFHGEETPETNPQAIDKSNCSFIKETLGPKPENEDIDDCRKQRQDERNPAPDIDYALKAEGLEAPDAEMDRSVKDLVELKAVDTDKIEPPKATVIEANEETLLAAEAPKDDDLKADEVALPVADLAEALEDVQKANEVPVAGLPVANPAEALEDDGLQAAGGALPVADLAEALDDVQEANGKELPVENGKELPVANPAEAVEDDGLEAAGGALPVANLAKPLEDAVLEAAGELPVADMAEALDDVKEANGKEVENGEELPAANPAEAVEDDGLQAAGGALPVANLAEALEDGVLEAAGELPVANMAEALEDDGQEARGALPVAELAEDLEDYGLEQDRDDQDELPEDDRIGANAPEDLAVFEVHAARPFEAEDIELEDDRSESPVSDPGALPEADQDRAESPRMDLAEAPEAERPERQRDFIAALNQDRAR